jgi:DNA-directed RNA polymerase alpha subunit
MLLKKNMNIDCLQLSFDTTDSSSSWRLQVSCDEEHWFDHVCCKVSFLDRVASIDSKATLTTQVFAQEQETPLVALNLSVRTRNTCKRAGINFVEELVALTDDEIVQIKSIGCQTLKEIREKLDIWRNSI